jgi:site-specific DNA recombinase
VATLPPPPGSKESNGEFREIDGPPTYDRNAPTTYNVDSSADEIIDFEDGDGTQAAAYIRVSSAKQVHGYSLDAQEKELKEMAAKLKVTRLYLFADRGKTGQDFDRRKLNGIQDLAEKKTIQMLLVTEVDRIGRQSRKLMSFLSDIRDCGVTVQTPSGSIDVNQLSGWLIAAIKGYVAQQDNERRARAAKAGATESFLKKHWSTDVPLGYRKTENRWIEKKSEWVEPIRLLYARFLELPKSSRPTTSAYERITRLFNDGYGCSLNVSLTRHQVNAILTKTVYAGLPRRFGQTIVDPDLAFVDEQTFQRAQELANAISALHKCRNLNPIKDLVARHGISALKFLDKVEYHHKGCGGVLKNHGTRLIEGLPLRSQIYICSKCPDEFWIPTKKNFMEIQGYFTCPTPRTKAEPGSADTLQLGFDRGKEPQKASRSVRSPNTSNLDKEQTMLDSLK